MVFFLKAQNVLQFKNMAITVNNLQISGTSTNQNYVQGNWIQNDAVTEINFIYLGVKNSTVSGGGAPGWFALQDNGGVDYGNNVGWYFFPVGDNGAFFLFFDVNTLA